MTCFMTLMQMVPVILDSGGADWAPGSPNVVPLSFAQWNAASTSSVSEPMEITLDFGIYPGPRRLCWRAI